MIVKHYGIHDETTMIFCNDECGASQFTELADTVNGSPFHTRFTEVLFQ